MSLFVIHVSFSPCLPEYTGQIWYIWFIIQAEELTEQKFWQMIAKQEGKFNEWQTIVWETYDNL